MVVLVPEWRGLFTAGFTFASCHDTVLRLPGVAPWTRFPRPIGRSPPGRCAGGCPGPFRVGALDKMPSRMSRRNGWSSGRVSQCFIKSYQIKGQKLRCTGVSQPFHGSAAAALCERGRAEAQLSGANFWGA